MKVLGLFDHDGVRRGQNLHPHDARVSGPYCVQFLMDEGIDLIPIAPARSRLHRKMRDVVEHRTGIRTDLAVRGMLRAARADAVLCMLEDKAVLPAALSRRGIPPYRCTPLAVVSCWWADEIERGTDADRDLISRTTDALDLIFTFSKNQTASFAKVGAAHKVVPITFGVDETWYTPREDAATAAVANDRVNTRFEVVAMGIDRGRDFKTLAAAAHLLPHRRFDVFTQPGRIPAGDVPPNMTMHAPVSMFEHRENLRDAQLVVVPTHDLAYPTGQSVLLEAMACGRPVAVTRTAAMSQYIDDYITNLALPLHDAVGVATVIDEALADPGLRRRLSSAAREAAVKRYSFRRTWHEAATALHERIQ